MVVIVCLSIFSQCVMKLGIVAWYEANKNYITENFCINKDKPELNCCGKCHLRKELKKVDDNGNSKKQNEKTEKSETVAFIIPESLQDSRLAALPDLSIQHPAGQHLFDSGIPIAVFRPPSAA